MIKYLVEYDDHTTEVFKYAIPYSCPKPVIAFHKYEDGRWERLDPEPINVDD